MICIVLKTPMGLRPLASGRCIKDAFAAVCVFQKGDEIMKRGVGILYPDTKRMFFAEEFSTDIAALWRGMYVASKMMYVGSEAVKLALLIAGETPLDDPCFEHASHYLSYDHTVASLRTKARAQTIPPDDIKKISVALGLSVEEPPGPKACESDWETKSRIVFLRHLSEMRDNASPLIAA